MKQLKMWENHRINRIYIKVSAGLFCRSDESCVKLFNVLSSECIDTRSGGVGRLAGSEPKAPSKSFFVRPD